MNFEWPLSLFSRLRYSAYFTWVSANYVQLVVSVGFSLYIRPRGPPSRSPLRESCSLKARKNETIIADHEGFSANIPVPSDIEYDMEYQYFGHSSVSFSMDLNGLLTYCASLSAKCLSDIFPSRFGTGVVQGLAPWNIYSPMRRSKIKGISYRFQDKEFGPQLYEPSSPKRTIAPAEF